MTEDLYNYTNNLDLKKYLGSNMSSSDYRLKIERLLLSIARIFINASISDIDHLIKSSLGSAVKMINVDRGYIYLFQNKNTQLELAYHFNQPDIKGKIQLHDQVDSSDFAWLVNTILEKKEIKVTSLEEIPPNATTIKYILQSEKTKSMILQPMILNGVAIGYVGFDTVNEEIKWTVETQYILNICADIFVRAIERKRAVEWGKESEEKLRMLFTQIKDGMFITTPGGKFLDINPAGVEMFGYSSEAEVLALDLERDLYDDPKEREKFKNILDKKGHVEDFELKLKRKDGDKITVLITATAVRDKRGKVEAYEGIIRNVTERRSLEEQLFQAQKMESIGLLAGGIAHDFNNILTAINGNAELILMKLDPANPLHKHMVSILKGGKRAEDLIRHLLAFSRKQMIKLKVVDINEVINDLYKMLKRLVSEDIHLELKLKDDLKPIKSDDTQLQQILVNLVVNAGHAIKDVKDKNRQKSITIITEEVNISENNKTEHPAELEGEYVIISVVDTGAGMDEETKQKIFDPFFTTKKEGAGTGLGLSTVYGIIKQNLGDIVVESEVGVGTIFKIYWPATETIKQQTTIKESKILFNQHSDKIFIVEDDPDVRTLAAEALKSFGYEVIEAENGVQALQKIQDENLTDKIDLLISDMVMPEMGGEELAEQVREINPKIKILLCSGYTQSRIFFNAQLGDNPYFFITKPYSIQNLQKKIRKILDNSKEKTSLQDLQTA